MQRRDFIKKLGLAAAGVIAAPYILPSGRLFAATGSRVVNHVVVCLFAGGVRNLESVQKMDGNLMPGAISATYTPTAAGWYSVLVTDVNGCQGNSDSIYVNPVGVESALVELEGLILYPNPSSGMVNLRTEQPIHGQVEISVWDMFGQQVKHFTVSQLINDVDFDLTDIANGMYLMKVSTKRGQQTSTTMIRFMIE